MFTITLEQNRQTVPFATAATLTHERNGNTVTRVVRKYRRQHNKVRLISVSQLPYSQRKWPSVRSKEFGGPAKGIRAHRDWLVAKGLLSPPDSIVAGHLLNSWDDFTEAHTDAQPCLVMDNKTKLAAYDEADPDNAPHFNPYVEVANA